MKDIRVINYGPHTNTKIYYDQKSNLYQTYYNSYTHKSKTWTSDVKSTTTPATAHDCLLEYNSYNFFQVQRPTNSVYLPILFNENHFTLFLHSYISYGQINHRYRYFWYTYLSSNQKYHIGVLINDNLRNKIFQNHLCNITKSYFLNNGFSFDKERENYILIGNQINL